MVYRFIVQVITVSLGCEVGSLRPQFLLMDTVFVSWYYNDNDNR